MTATIGREAALVTPGDAGSGWLLGAVDDLIADRVAGVCAVLEEVGGDATAYGAHGLDLAEQLRQRTAVPGKRARPLLALAGHRAALSGSSAAADGIGAAGHLVSLGAALELLHLFALVHDDVMDRSATRRGLETTHHLAERRHRDSGARGDASRYGDSVAILLGDLLFAEASDVVADLPRRVRQAWRRMVVELVHGQLLDVTATASRTPGDAAASTLVARLKTGRYTVRRPVELGALLVADGSGAPGAPGAPGAAGALDAPAALDALATWGDLVGDAFGLRDDVLGVWGDPAATGKPAWQDLRDGTATRLLAWSAEQLTGDDRALLDRCRAGELDDPIAAPSAAALAAAMEAAGVRDRAEREIDRLLDDAAAALDGCHDIAPAERAHLTDLAVRLARRTR